MIVLLIVVLVLLLGFIGYTIVSSKSKTLSVSKASQPVNRPNSGTAAPTPTNPDDEEVTRVRVAGPRLVRTIGGLKLGDEMLISGVLTIGRGQASTVRFNDAELSAVHAEFRLEGGVSVVTDLGSTNGTFVNGERVEANTPIPLKEDDQIRVGTINLVFKQGK